MASEFDVSVRTHATTAKGAKDSSLLLRFNSMTLDELSEELDRRIRETQRLQEEVENATKLALERFGCKYSLSSSPGQSCHDHTLNASTRPQDLSNHEVAQGQISSPGNYMLKNAIVDIGEWLPHVQMHDQPKQEMFSFDSAIANLQTKLHQVQMEKAILSELRLKDSRKHVDQMEQMLCMLEELQNIKRATDQKLQQSENETLALNMKINTLEEIMKETYSSLLSYKEQHGNTSVSRPEDTSQPPSAANVIDDLRNDTEKLQDRFLLTAEQLEMDDCNINTQRHRMKELIADLCQEMALLSGKLSSSNDNSVSLSVKLELLGKLAERQTSLQECQVGELESTLSNFKDSIQSLEEQLLQIQSQLVEAQTERERSAGPFDQLEAQLHKLKRSSELQQCEAVKTLRERLQETTEQLWRAVEEKNSLQLLLNKRIQEGRKAQEILREKDEEIQLKQQEAQEHRSQCHTLQVGGEMLRLKLDDREKQIEGLQLQVERSNRMTSQQSHTIDHLLQDNSLLRNQINQHKMELQQLTAVLDQHKSNLTAVECEKKQLQVAVAEHKQCVQEESLEKKRLNAQLEVHRLQLLTLTKENEELQRLHSCRNEEHEGVALRLQGQLKSARDELDQVRKTLRTVEGTDRHGLQKAMDMQKEITDRREQVDSLQSKIQHLEQTMEKLYQEKRYQAMEQQHQLQELTFVRKENKQLSNELEALRSKDQQLRDRICKLEPILHKMTESFADCQDFIQLQEQEFYRLKLQHVLDLKEFQGQTLQTALNIPPDLDSLNSSELIGPPSAQHASNTCIKTSPTQELRSLVKELREVISETRRPHTDDSAAGSGLHRRRSAPGKVQKTTFCNDKAEGVKVGSRLRRTSCDSKLHSLKEAESKGKTENKETIIESCVASSPAASFLKYLSLGRRSPVHSLLTSNPNS